MTVYTIDSTQFIRRSGIDGLINHNIKTEADKAAEVLIEEIISRYGSEKSQPHSYDVVLEEVLTDVDVYGRDRSGEQRTVTFLRRNVEYEWLGENDDVDEDGDIVEEEDDDGVAVNELNQDKAMQHMY